MWGARSVTHRQCLTMLVVTAGQASRTRLSWIERSIVARQASLFSSECIGSPTRGLSCGVSRPKTLKTMFYTQISHDLCAELCRLPGVRFHRSREVRRGTSRLAHSLSTHPETCVRVPSKRPAVRVCACEPSLTKQWV